MTGPLDETDGFLPPRLLTNDELAYWLDVTAARSMEFEAVIVVRDSHPVSFDATVAAFREIARRLRDDD